MRVNVEKDAIRRQKSNVRLHRMVLSTRVEGGRDRDKGVGIVLFRVNNGGAVMRMLGNKVCKTKEYICEVLTGGVGI